MFQFAKKWFTGNKYGLPKELIDRLRSPAVTTPDYADLQSRKHNLVLLYGNDMSKGREAFPDVKPLYTDVYTEDPYVMVKVKEGQKITPAVLNPPGNVVGGPIGRLPKARVKGELYQLSANEIAELDKLRENGVIFNRIRVKARVEHYALSAHDHGEVKISEPLHYVKRVFMYVGNYDFFAFTKISPHSIHLLKVRENNQLYEPRYYFSPQDWG